MAKKEFLGVVMVCTLEIATVWRVSYPPVGDWLGAQLAKLCQYIYVHQTRDILYTSRISLVSSIYLIYY